MSTAELNTVARDLIEVRRMIAELEAEETALQDKIKAEMTERGAETILGDGWKASWKNITSRRFDARNGTDDFMKMLLHPYEKE